MDSKLPFLSTLPDFPDDGAYTELIDEDTHWRLKHDLVEHLGSLDLPHLEVDSDDE
ncbi:hypothetical protein HanHA300_Chr03g0089571 [Helianthus annuus]|nr:hypothetical protein HanHA300_Chr03g0089571 [Helianthus annuus]